MRRSTIVPLLAGLMALAMVPTATAAEPEDPAAGQEDALMARGMHTATLLPDGRVLVVGGFAEDGTEAIEVEVWDPETERSMVVGTLTQARWGQTASLLADGRVLVVGGGAQGDPAGERPDRDGPFSLSSAEVWGPDQGFEPAGSMALARRGHSATVMPDGRVLIVGGTETDEAVPAEIWDPESGSFSAVGSPLIGRNWGHTATLLPDGRVLIVGGQGATGIGTYDMALEELAPAETWDPGTGEFAEAGALDIGRTFHTASLLPDGRVLIMGGFGTDNEGVPTVFDSAVAWDPATNSFTDVAMMEAMRVGHDASVLPDGRVVISGGLGFEGEPPDPEADIGPSMPTLVEIFDPATNEFEPAGRLSEGRDYGTATTLADGRVLLIGGGSHEGALVSGFEIWTPPGDPQASD